jgi:hypothetical protein
MEQPKINYVHFHSYKGQFNLIGKEHSVAITIHFPEGLEFEWEGKKHPRFSAGTFDMEHEGTHSDNTTLPDLAELIRQENKKYLISTDRKEKLALSEHLDAIHVYNERLKVEYRYLKAKWDMEQAVEALEAAIRDKASLPSLHFITNGPHAQTWSAYKDGYRGRGETPWEALSDLDAQSELEAVKEFKAKMAGHESPQS